MAIIRNVVCFAIFLASLLDLCSSYGYSDVTYSTAVSPVVATYSGTIRGKRMAIGGTEISAFLGIPYAEPPVGNYRFQKALPKRSWEGIYEATKMPPPCMQYSKKDFQWISKTTSNEDCLYLNLWVTGRMKYLDLEPNGKPVLLWIHGGGYFSGSSEVDVYDGAVLAAQSNVIVVSINYRLGAFGFLTAGTDEAPGNMGMHDQVLAMEWVRHNIRQFNGDPDKITLFGQSAGAVSVGLHLISPLSRDLFRRAIMMSGSPYHPILAGNSSVMVYASNLFATAVGCADDTANMFTNPKGVVDCLKKLDPQQLAIAESFMLEKVPFVFLPIHGDDFMPVNPMIAMDNGDFKQTQVLIGSTPDEGALFLHYLMPDVFGSQVALDLSVDQAALFIGGLFQNSTNPPPEVVANFYLKDAQNSDPAATRKSVYDSYGDFLFHCPSVFFAEKFSKAGDSFFYLFSHRSSNSPWGDWMGVTHFDDVPYVFGDPFRNSSAYTTEEKLFSRTVIQKLATFATSGVPVKSKNGERWPKFTYEHPRYLELNPKTQGVYEIPPHAEACDFWREFFISSP